MTNFYGLLNVAPLRKWLTGNCLHNGAKARNGSSNDAGPKLERRFVDRRSKNGKKVNLENFGSILPFISITNEHNFTFTD